MRTFHLNWLPLLLLPALVPAAAQTAGTPLELSLKHAIEIALAPDGNARVQIARQMIRQAQERANQARATLLPNLDASVSQQNQTRNLAAFGIRIEAPIPGFRIPELVGPFNTFDARATATQTIFDFGAIRRYQASRAGIGAAGAENDATRDQVALQVAGLYFASLRAEARVQAAEANVKLAEELLQLAENQKTAGTGTGLEITRAQVQLANERQLLLVARNERRQANLQLLKAMGLPLVTPLLFSYQLARVPVEETTPEKALAVALESRADLKAQRQREESARLSYSGAKMERLPSVVGFADYGTIGTSIHNTVPTRTYGLSVRVPVFDGGRRDARRAESGSLFEQEKIRTADLKRQIDLELRLSLDSLRSAEEQVNVAEDGLKQAEDELARASRRYKAGVANSLEVTDAQTRLARARDNRISALYLYNQARVELGQALGTIQQMVD
ncbi:MAG TPA: TolC family protein [Bryobacteraceae bacterium]|nr:TolC family protein [Bryobacteraceae bacterium]